MVPIPLAESTCPCMGTVMSLKAFGENADASLQEVKRAALRLEHLLSRFLPNSEISAINKHAGLSLQKLSTETYDVLTQAVQIAGICQSGFDITVGPLVHLWTVNNSDAKPPNGTLIKQVLPLVNYRDVILDPDQTKAGLSHIGQSIDLGGIGKGYASAKFVEICKNQGITSAFVNIGGNVLTLGRKPNGESWRIGIQHPRQESSLVGLVCVSDKAVVTSGDYQRYFTDEAGNKYHHIIDPTTGYPAQSGLISVTIVADNATIADALSTAVFVAGMQKGLALIKRFPGTEAIFIDEKLQVNVTIGLKDNFQGAQDFNVRFV